jgi:RNA polymerase sigma-70 factor (ECF subfamily)
MPAAADPAERLVLKQSIQLAFVTALQHLQPKPRAALLLTDVLGFSAAEAAEVLETSVASINSALQRARAAVERLQRQSARTPVCLSAAQQDVLSRYVAAFEAYDVPALMGLLRDDAVMNMPPYALWVRGPRDIHEWFLGPGVGCRGSRLVATEASGLPAFAQYRPDPAGGHRAWALNVLELDGDAVATMTAFLDVETLFSRFDLPLTLPGPAVRT